MNRQQSQTIFNKQWCLSPKVIQEKALAEFDSLVEQLERSRSKGTSNVEDTMNPQTPDSIFPNNWISFHEDGIVAVYPMEAVNRRKERREDVIAARRVSSWC